MLNGYDENYYLKSGKKTEVGDKVNELAKHIQGSNTKETVDQIVQIIIENVPRKKDNHDDKKFKRSAEEIVSDGYRNGCCDSSTLFVALCRAKGIPAVQLITADFIAMNNGNFGKGHFFSGYYSKERQEWIVIDSDVYQEKIDKYGLFKEKFNPNSEFILDNFYLFAIERDYEDFEIEDIKIESIKNMHEIHKYVYYKYMLANTMTNFKKRNTLKTILMSEKNLSVDYLETKKEEIFDIINELKAEDGFDQRSNWHIYDVWKHTEVALSNSKQDFEERLALLLHDIGKPHSYQDDGEIRHFRNHAEKSEKMSNTILNKLGYSKTTINLILFLIKNHSTVINVDDINEGNIELYNKLLDIQYCDAKAYNPAMNPQVLQRLDEIRMKLEHLKKFFKDDNNVEK